MPPTVPTNSLDPYLRARQVNPSLVPNGQPRQWRAQKKQTTNDDFVAFLRKLVQLALSPITVPLQWIHAALTSPLTISLAIKLAVLGLLALGSGLFSMLAVGAWWYSWGTGAPIEVEGWLFYGSKTHRTPHVMIPLPIERFQEDLRYDVQVEMELVRPSKGNEEMGNFMLSLQLRSARDTELVVLGASQPSLPPPPLQLGFVPIPTFPVHLLPPCVIPWPFRSFCPSRLLGYDKNTRSLSKRRRRRSQSSPTREKDVVPLTKELMEGVIVKPIRGGDASVGAAFVSIGREDAFNENGEVNKNYHAKEVKTTGWVIVRFIPRPTGIRWLLSAHPLPPLLILPPLSLALTLGSSTIVFALISYFFPKTLKNASTADKKGKSANGTTTEESLLAEKRRVAFETQDKEERREGARRRREWEEVESSALGGLQRMPEGRKRESTIGGSETTAPTQVSWAGLPDAPESPGSSATGDGSRADAESDGWA